MKYFFKNYKFISLGYNCNIKRYMKNMDPNEKQETNLFDYTGISMWGINKLFENDFNDLVNLNEYENILILKNDEKLVTNKKYYMRFKHDLRIIEDTNIVKTPINSKDNSKFLLSNIINTNIMTQFKKNFHIFAAMCERRIVRLKKLLDNEKKILFIRTEESMKNRIIYDEYKENFQQSELEYIKDYSNIIKTQYPNLDFKIIYISKLNESRYMEEYNLLILNTDLENINWENCVNKFIKLFEDNKNLLCLMDNNYSS